MIRTKGEAGTGDIVEAVRHMRAIKREISYLVSLDKAELMSEAKKLGAPYNLVLEVAKTGKLPVPNFAAGGIATPADAALMMQLGAETVFVGSGIFKSEDPIQRARAIVGAATYYNDPEMLAKISMGLLNAMKGEDIQQMRREDLYSQRGW
jgi:pyridoxal 5'-phosphate synthase pdxS subunit